MDTAPSAIQIREYFLSTRHALIVSRVNKVSKNIWGLERRGIQIMLYRLQAGTGLNCNQHTFRRTFASNLHRAGLDIEHIMRLGGWKSLDMVLRYTRSVRFEESVWGLAKWDDRRKINIVFKITEPDVQTF